MMYEQQRRKAGGEALGPWVLFLYIYTFDEPFEPRNHHAIYIFIYKALLHRTRFLSSEVTILHRTQEMRGASFAVEPGGRSNTLPGFIIHLLIRRKRCPCQLSVLRPREPRSMEQGENVLGVYSLLELLHQEHRFGAQLIR